MLREQDAIASRHESAFHELVKDFIIGVRSGAINNSNFKTSLGDMQSKLLEAMDASKTKVSLAKYMRQMVEQNVKKLEDEVCAFEEEMRLARTYGEFEDEDDEEDASSEAARKSAAKRKKSANNNAKREEFNEISRGNSPKMASSPAEFDEVPMEPPTTSTTNANSVKGKSGRSNGQAAITEAVVKSPVVSPVSAASPTTATGTIEPTYCYCNQVSFGEMIGCDNPDCPIEWFHYGCVGLEAPPAGKWYCRDCTATINKSGNIVIPESRKSK